MMHMRLENKLAKSSNLSIVFRTYTARVTVAFASCLLDASALLTCSSYARHARRLPRHLLLHFLDFSYHG